MKNLLPWIAVAIMVLCAIVIVYTNFRSRTGGDISDVYVKQELEAREKQQTALQEFIDQQTKFVIEFSRNDSTIMQEFRQTRATFKTEIEKLRQQKNENINRIDNFNSAELRRAFAELEE